MNGKSMVLVAAVVLVGVGRPVTAQRVEVGEAVRVMEAPSWGALVEPHLTAHPSEPGWLLGAVIVSDTVGPPSERTHCAWVLSRDGGGTWTRGRFGIRNCVDPRMAITGSGEAVFLALGQHPVAERPEGWELLVARSPDGGASWNDTLTSLGGGQDRPTLIVDPRESEARSAVVVSGQGTRLDDRPIRFSVFVARSEDAGRTFRLPVNVFPSNLNLNAAESVALSDGTFLVSFVDFMRNVDGFRSREGMLERRRIWVLRSTDGGRSFSMPLFVSERCGMSAYDVAADLSGGLHHGRAYLACREIEGTAVLLHHSDDQGETWMSPRPVAGSGADGWTAYNPRLAVDANGVLGLAWVESQVEGDATCNRTLAALSTDGGDGFSLPATLSPRTCPDPGRNGFAFQRWRQGGDYFGWAAGADGGFRALWTDGRHGPFELWSARVAVAE